MLALPHIASGKVREIYEIDADRLLFVATDRISAFDVVLNQDIPDKGRVLTGLSLHFFEYLDTPNHFLSTDLSGIPGLTDDDLDWLHGRAMVVRRAEVIPVECVVRGYLYGSSWREYRDGGGPTTEHLPAGLRLADKLDEPIFTPATKEASGHDVNIDEATAREILGDDLYEELRSRSLDIYRRAADYAADRGVILADTMRAFTRSLISATIASSERVKARMMSARETIPWTCSSWVTTRRLTPSRSMRRAASV